MDERAAVPPGLPRTNPTSSYWMNPASDIAYTRSTPDLPHKASYLIVGSGISGASIAYHLLKSLGDAGRREDVVMLEARQTCGGATGRNGGHTKAASYRSFPLNAKNHGIAEAVKIAKLEYDNIRTTHRLATDLNLDCESRSCDTVDIIYSPDVWSSTQDAVRLLRSSIDADDPAAQYELLNGDTQATEIESRFHTPFEPATIHGAVIYPAGSIHSYKFATGLLKHCLAKGLNLQTGTAVTNICSAGPRSWIVETERGAITTQRLILATNAHTAHLLPQLQSKIVPLRGQVTAQRCGPSLAAQAPNGLRTTYSFIYDEGYEYMIPRPSTPSVPAENRGDIIIGGGLGALPDNGLSEYGNTDDSIVNTANSAYLRDTLVRYFGRNWGADDASSRVKAEWTGIMGVTADGLPFVGPVPGMDGVWVSAGFNGHGMVLCLKCAEALVHMLTSETAECPAWFPEAFIITERRLVESRFGGRVGMRISKVGESQDARAEKYA